MHDLYLFWDPQDNDFTLNWTERGNGVSGKFVVLSSVNNYQWTCQESTYFDGYQATGRSGQSWATAHTMVEENISEKEVICFLTGILNVWLNYNCIMYQINRKYLETSSAKVQAGLSK